MLKGSSNFLLEQNENGVISPSDMLFEMDDSDSEEEDGVSAEFSIGSNFQYNLEPETIKPEIMEASSIPRSTPINIVPGQVGESPPKTMMKYFELRTSQENMSLVGSPPQKGSMTPENRRRALLHI